MSATSTMPSRTDLARAAGGTHPNAWSVWLLERASDPNRPISYGIVQTGPRIPGGIRCVRVVDIANGTINQADLITTSQSISDSYKRTVLCAGDLVIALRGKLGAIALVDETLTGANLTRGVALIALRGGYHADFLRHYLSSPNSKDFFERNLNGSALREIPIATLRKVPVAWPLLDEQRAIAEALSDADVLISALDHLIAKKRAIKLATAQQLLSGQIRLQGFGTPKAQFRGTVTSTIPLDWDSPTLGELFAFKNGLNKAKEFFGHGTPIVNYMDVYRRRGLFVHDLDGRVSVGPRELKAFEVRRGDVFFTRTSETADEIGISSVMLDEPKDTVFSGFVLRARPKDASLDDGFKKYCFSTSLVRQQIVAQTTETTRALTNGRYLSTVVIARPPKPEQAAIATVLSDMDAEITALERRRDKTKAIKQGMMQELLTGMTRLL